MQYGESYDQMRVKNTPSGWKFPQRDMRVKALVSTLDEELVLKHKQFTLLPNLFFDYLFHMQKKKICSWLLYKQTRLSQTWI